MKSAFHNSQEIMTLLLQPRKHLLLMKDDAAYQIEGVHSSTVKARKSRHICVLVRDRPSPMRVTQTRTRTESTDHMRLWMVVSMYVATKVVPDNGDIPYVVLGKCTLAGVECRNYRLFTSASHCTPALRLKVSITEPCD